MGNLSAIEIITRISTVVIIYFLLVIPDNEPFENKEVDSMPFEWNQDAYWKALEDEFVQFKKLPCEKIAADVDVGLVSIHEILDEISARLLSPEAIEFSILENLIFETAPRVAACPEKLTEFAQMISNVREVVKYQSFTWDMNDSESKNRIYRLLYGSRLALEEAILQDQTGNFPDLLKRSSVQSPTPSADILGLTLHSGDILVSRGGAPTSSLIARGNDYAGNFSHVALVHIDEFGEISIIESHIEVGVVVSSVDDYLQDKKLRIMVLRPRPGMSMLSIDPMIPHKAATFALERTRSEKIPYDFEMNYQDHEKLFCSEVASAAYEQYSVNLWTGISTISSKGTQNWLASFGVRYFETHEPSDLEYDPQLQVVAEWRDKETLFKDHVDNAVVDALLEEAEAGQPLTYSSIMLPIARLVKGFSNIMNMFGWVGPIPQGMTTMAAMRVDRFTSRHDSIVEKVLARADEFKNENGYVPPYWKLVEIAREEK